MTKILKNSDSEGLKVLVHLVKPMSDAGFSKMPNLKRKNNIYKPLKPVIVIPSYISTKKELAELIYNTFGCEEGNKTTYCLRYWRKRGRWSRRIAHLCSLELWDKPDGSFGFKFLSMGVLRRFGFWDD